MKLKNDKTPDIEKEPNLLNEINSWRPYKITSEREYLYVTDSLSCKRKVFWDMKNETPSDDILDDIAWQLFSHGDLLHEGIVNKYKKSGMYIDDEVSIKIQRDEDLLYSGRIDLLIRHDEITVPVEIKSIKDFAYKGLTKKNGTVVVVGARDSPKTEHIAQLQLYLESGGFPYGFIHYINKNTDEETLWKVYKDKKEIDKLLERAKDVIEHIKKNEAPDREYNAIVRTMKDGTKKVTKYGKNGVGTSDWQCIYCKYKTKCWIDGGDD